MPLPKINFFSWRVWLLNLKDTIKSIWLKKVKTAIPGALTENENVTSFLQQHICNTDLQLDHLESYGIFKMDIICASFLPLFFHRPELFLFF